MNNSTKNILVCCDGSKYSKKAISKACEIAKDLKANLFFMYVVDKSVGIDFFDRKEYILLLRKYGKRVLDNASKFAKEKGLDGKKIIKEGKISNEIIKYSNVINCDLIVVGSKGLGAIPKFFLGSISTNIVNHSKCSVLVVK